MQIQARASRGVKSRRVGGGSNFHETFPRMNEGRRIERLRSIRREYTYRHFYFRPFSPRFSIVFPSDSAANLVRKFACSSRPVCYRSPLFRKRGIYDVSSRRSSRYPSIPSPSAIRVPRRDFSAVISKFLKFSAFRGEANILSWNGESRESRRVANATRQLTTRGK